MAFRPWAARRASAFVLLVLLLSATPPATAQGDFVQLARDAKKAGEVDKAIHLLEEGLVDHPDNASAHYVLGWLYVAQEEEAKATAAFRCVVKLKPDSDEGREALAALERMGEAGSAAARDGPTPPLPVESLPRPQPRILRLVSADGFPTLQEAIDEADHVFIPADTYELNQSLVIEGKEDAVVIGAGRKEFGAHLRFRQGTGLRIRNCRRVLIANLWIRPQTTFDAPAVEVVGDTPSHVTFLNVVITGGTVQGPDQGTGAPGLKVAAPGQAIVQACWFFEADPGLLVAHPQADVRVISGNFISNMVHTRQTAGHLEAYSVAGGFSYAGADI